jgi:hypothetical protein
MGSLAMRATNRGKGVTAFVFTGNVCSDFVQAVEALEKVG